MASIVEIELARLEAVLPLDLALVKPAGVLFSFRLRYGSPIAFQSCKSVLIAAAYFTWIFHLLWLVKRAEELIVKK